MPVFTPLEELPAPVLRQVSSIQERIERNRVVGIARTWLGTPYHHEARLKGAGIDCATLLAEVFAEARLIPRVALPHYSCQWHLHRHEEKLLGVLRRLATEVDRAPRPGDVVCWKFYKLFAHGSIATQWPRIIHSHIASGRVEEESVDTARWLSHVSEAGPDQGRPRPFKVFTFWGAGAHAGAR